MLRQGLERDPKVKAELPVKKMYLGVVFIAGRFAMFAQYERTAGGDYDDDDVNILVDGVRSRVLRVCCVTCAMSKGECLLERFPMAS